MSVEQARLEKERLRAEIRGALRCVDANQVRVASGVIADRLRASLAWRAASQVAAFVSLPGEIDTHTLLSHALVDGKEVLLPRTLGRGRMEFAQPASLDSLVEGRYGVREPGSDCPPRALTKAALVIVPGLAFDRDGGRLGRGAGYYDRALAGAVRPSGRPLCLGVGLALQIVERVPMSPLDVAMDGLVTEEELLLLG